MNSIFYAISGPPIAGGHHVNVMHVQALRQMKLRASLLYWPSGQTVERFDTKAPVVLFQSPMTFKLQDIVVIPEGWRIPLNFFASKPCRKILHCQNPFYIFQGVDSIHDYKQLGIERAIVCSEFTKCSLVSLGFDLPIDVVRPCLAPEFFSYVDKPKPENIQIAYMPRKRPIESRYLIQLFKSMYPAFKDLSWVPIHEMTHQQCAEVLAQSSVFASFSSLEGLGLPPLEAMACACIPVGFLGHGGAEYANSNNGYWVNEADYESFANSLCQAIVTSQNLQSRKMFLDAARQTLKDYDQNTFAKTIEETWRNILGDDLDRFILDSN
jgi:glycosyltransferase involved in cell wall biosynthesis